MLRALAGMLWGGGLILYSSNPEGHLTGTEFQFQYLQASP